MESRPISQGDKKLATRFLDLLSDKKFVTELEEIRKKRSKSKGLLPPVGEAIASKYRLGEDGEFFIDKFIRNGSIAELRKEVESKIRGCRIISYFTEDERTYFEDEDSPIAQTREQEGLSPQYPVAILCPPGMSINDIVDFIHKNKEQLDKSLLRYGRRMVTRRRPKQYETDLILRLLDEGNDWGTIKKLYGEDTGDHHLSEKEISNAIKAREKRIKIAKQ